MKKLFLLLMAALVTIGFMSGCGANSGSNAPQMSVSASNSPSEKAETDTVPAKSDPIYIGAIAPITDDYGVYIQQACELAVQKINEQGGVLGRKVELILEDETFEQQGSINAMLKLYNRGDLAVVLGSSGNSNCLAVIDIVNDYGIPTIMNGGNITFDQHGNEWVWQIRMSDADKGKVYANVIKERMNVTKLAVLHQTDAAGGPRERALTALKDLYGMEPVISLTYDKNTETDYTKYVMQIQATDADGLLLISEQVASPLIMKAIQDLKLDIPGVGPAAVSEDLVIRNAGSAANGWYSITEWTNEQTEPIKAEFVEAYTEYTGRVPSWAAAVYYDSVMLACKAIENAGTTDPAAVNAAMAQIKNMDGVISTLSYHENHTFADTIYVVQVQDGKAVITDQVAPAND